MFSLLLTGDVMLGRGVDQIQLHPCNPALPDRRVSSARDFVRAAERKHGSISTPVTPDYVWGDALPILQRLAPDARVINLETAITTASMHAPKQITYRMNPSNIEVLRAFGPDCCVLANNHVLDWGNAGLLETLVTLDSAGIGRAGAGHDADDAWRAKVLLRPGGGKLIVVGMADRSSGVPSGWGAGPGKPGVALLEGSIDASVARVAGEVARVKEEGDLAIASIHWGPNWGYRISPGQVAFARKLIDDAGVDLVHGHSSHHPQQIGLYKGRVIIFGCGDLINDYEGISGYQEFRADLVVMYLVTFEGARARRVTILPFRIQRLSLQRATLADAEWLAERVTRHSANFGTAWKLASDATIHVART